MRILVASTPGLGHINAVAPLMSALRAGGHDLLVVTAAESCELVERLGFDVRAGGMAAADRRAALAPRMAEILALPPRQRRRLYFSGFFADIAAPVMRLDLASAFDEFRPDLVVHEIAELAAGPMAAARDIPHVTVAFSGSLPESDWNLLVERIEPIWRAEGMPSPTLDDIFGDLYLHPFPPSFGQSPPSRSVRPMRAEGASGVPEPPPPWLSSLGLDRPLVYVTAGTEPLAELFPWATVVEALGERQLDAIATIGNHLDPSVLGPVPANVRVERFVPQHMILERTSVVVSHAGAGSVLGAARRGLPQLLNPIRADQWQNADAAAHAGVAIACELDERATDRIGRSLDRLLTNAAFADASSRVAAEIAAMPSPADHVSTIEAIAAR